MENFNAVNLVKAVIRFETDANSPTFLMVSLLMSLSKFHLNEYLLKREVEETHKKNFSTPKTEEVEMTLS